MRGGSYSKSRSPPPHHTLPSGYSAAGVLPEPAVSQLLWQHCILMPPDTAAHRKWEREGGAEWWDISLNHCQYVSHHSRGSFLWGNNRNVEIIRSNAILNILYCGLYSIGPWRLSVTAALHFSEEELLERNTSAAYNKIFNTFCLAICFTCPRPLDDLKKAPIVHPLNNAGVLLLIFLKERWCVWVFITPEHLLLHRAPEALIHFSSWNQFNFSESSTYQCHCRVRTTNKVNVG